MRFEIEIRYIPLSVLISACRPAAELASYWNKPIVSWVATDPDFNDKSVFTTLGRVLGPFNKMGVFLAEVFAQYGWKRCAVLSSNYFLWYVPYYAR